MPPKLIVIDTQSLFDWLVFRNPTCQAWTSLLGSGEWRWIFTPAMKAEFDFVAAKGFGERWRVPHDEAQERWDGLAEAVPPAPPLGAGARLHCTDPDDQKFIDLAIAEGAHTLISRDKALLRLARRAAALHGLRICTPAAWTADTGAARCG